MLNYSITSKTNICDITHPDYFTSANDWFKWRLTYKGGSTFINQYLKRYSSRESVADFSARKEMTYNPAFAKAGIDDVKNAIYQRMADISRTDGSTSYHKAARGLDGGVDLKGSTMNKFIGCELLPELLAMGKVGVFIDMPTLQGNDIISNVNARPYIYFYRIEDIRSWVIDSTNNSNDFEAVLLRDCAIEYDEATGFPKGITETFRHMWREDGKVFVEIYKERGETVNDNPIMLNLTKIPFVMLDIHGSLMEDICDYQISLLNLASSDIAFTLKANFPFYTEQYDQQTDLARSLMKTSQGTIDPETGVIDPDTEGTEASVASGEHEVQVGTNDGRRYPMGAERPGFIHPSSEPMQASMAKQEQLKTEIRLLLNLALTNMQPMRASAESKATDDRGLEAGLSHIGLTLESAERQIGDIWAQYEDTGTPSIIYPVDYSLKSDKERREESNDYFEKMEKIPSHTYQREIAKIASNTLLGGTVSQETLDKINSEIDKAPNMSADAEVIRADVETGLVSHTLASELRGYPKGEADKAKQEHVDRLAAIAEAQAEAKTDDAAAASARGVVDQDADPNSGKLEKAESRETDNNSDPKDNTRGNSRKVE